VAEETLPDPPIAPRIPGEGVHPLREILPGLDEQPVFASVCDGFDPEELWAQAHVVCFRGDGYPRVDDHTGHILCPDAYARDYPPAIVYLDLVHELVHVRQVLEGEPVYHFPEPYVRWPTEIEAYRITYEEARRVGLSDAWFWDYLAVPWVEKDELVELAEAIGLGAPPHATERREDEEGARH
jgi:hypothetical protein